MDKIPQSIIDLLNSLSCETVAERLNLEVVKHKTLCFMHDDHHPSLYFYGSNREKWRCFVCNKGGGAISLVMESSGCGFVEACQWLGEQFNITIEGTKGIKLPSKNVRIRYPIISEPVKPFCKEVAQWILDNYTLTESGQHFLFEERKLDPNVIQQLKIVSIEDCRSIINRLQDCFDMETIWNSGLVSTESKRFYFRMFTPCLLFPYFDSTGGLIGLQSRYLGENKEAPRFQFVSAQKTRLFNLPILGSMKDGEDLYISEGITDCLALLSSGKKAVAIPSATILPQNDLIDLLKYKLHMYPDQDDAGKKAFVALRRYFINHYTNLIEEILPEGSEDYSEYFIAYHKTK